MTRAPLCNQANADNAALLCLTYRMGISTRKNTVTVDGREKLMDLVLCHAGSKSNVRSLGVRLLAFLHRLPDSHQCHSASGNGDGTMTTAFILAGTATAQCDMSVLVSLSSYL